MAVLISLVLGPEVARVLAQRRASGNARDREGVWPETSVNPGNEAKGNLL